MLFNSGAFLLFMLIVWVVHWTVAARSARLQNVVLLVASAVFYGMADIRFLVLLTFSALVNYALGSRIAGLPEGTARSRWFWLGVTLNLGTLIYFKYFNFFLTGVVQLLGSFGLELEPGTLVVLLPLGISFYTFQMLGYLIDIQHEETEPCKDPVDFLTYVLYFPKMLAGPIERAQRFLPQIAVTRVLDPQLIGDGMRQILWGLFAKVVIADDLNEYVNNVFDNYTEHGSITLLFGVMLYLIQIYCDFSGYSNIALGVSKLLGIRLMLNFAYPLFGTNISDFWRKWHISLTTWMIDYVFTPLSFLLRDKGKLGLVISISVTFLAVGIWHGANWTYVLFGVLQSIYFIPLALSQGINKASAYSLTSRLPTFGQTWRMLFMFVLMSLTFGLLRAPSLAHAAAMASGIFTSPQIAVTRWVPAMIMVPILVLILVEWMQRSKDHALQLDRAKWPAWSRYTIYLVIAELVLWKSGKEADFIYFQF